MRFEPKTENEIASANLWPAGEYDFEVFEAEEQQSKAGNDMVKLSIYIFNQDGQRRGVFDYLVDTEGGAYKIRHFAEAVGLLEQYNGGELLADDMVRRAGRCKVNIQKDKAGQYPDKNGIADYLPPKPQQDASRLKFGVRATSRAAVPAGDIDDEIPF